MDAEFWGASINATTVVTTLALVVLWLSESLVPWVRIGPRVRHDLANLGLGAINATLAVVALAAAVTWATEWASAAGIGLLHAVDWPTPVEWLLALILFDLWMYAWHVLNHRVPVLWRLHAVHHADRKMDVTSGVRFHTLEIVLSTLARCIVLPLLGMSIQQLLLYEAITAPIILFHHSNLRVPARLDRWLRVLTVTPRMHRVHHSVERVETDSNFTSGLSIWDRIFGTFRLRSDPEAIRVGLNDHTEKESEQLGAMLAAPFSRRDPTSTPVA